MIGVLRPPLVALGAFMAATCLLAAACSTDPEPAGPEVEGPRAVAESMIAEELASEVGLGPLVGVCSELGPLVIGSSFACTATTGPGDVIQIQGVVNPEGHLQLTTTNLVSIAALPSFERGAAAALNSEVGSDFTAEAVDCGDAAVVLPSDFTMGCALVMPSSGQVFDLTLTITDLDARNFSLVVAENPRPAESESESS